jgi:hypothetical protein
MGGNQRRTGFARSPQRRLEPVVHADEAPQADRHRVRGTPRVGVEAGQLEAGHDQQVVERSPRAASCSTECR